MIDIKHCIKCWKEDVTVFVTVLQATGLTGLAVASHPHHTLGVLYGKILRCLQKMPPDAAYRKYTEQTITERFNYVKTVNIQLCSGDGWVWQCTP